MSFNIGISGATGVTGEVTLCILEQRAFPVNELRLLDKNVTAREARRVLEAFPGVQVFDEPWNGRYPTPLAAAGIDDVLVGRVRSVPFVRNGLSVFASGDNLRKGNALNAIQVAERVLGRA